MSAPRFEQLPLSLRLAEDATFANYYTSNANALAISELKRQARGEGEQWLFLVGAPGSGRSHLLQACCHLADETGGYARYLPMRELRHHAPDAVLEGAETLGLLCVDDVDLVVGHPEWEEALFHCYNRCLASGTGMLLSAARPAAELSCGLADLKSRLNGFSVYQLRSMDESERIRALQFRGRCVGLELTEDVAAFIYARSSRHPGDLFAVLDRLDRASLAQRRRLTIPFVKTVLGW